MRMKNKETEIAIYLLKQSGLPLIAAARLVLELVDGCGDMARCRRAVVLGTEALKKEEQSVPFANIDYRLVKDDLDRVLELQPSFPEAYFNRANVSVRLKDYKSAIVDYTPAIALNDRFAQAYYNRGLAKIYTGNIDGGVADLSKAGELGMYQAYSVIKRFR